MKPLCLQPQPSHSGVVTTVASDGAGGKKLRHVTTRRGCKSTVGKESQGWGRSLPWAPKVGMGEGMGSESLLIWGPSSLIWLTDTETFT